MTTTVNDLVAAVDAFVGAGELPAAEELVAQVQSLPRTVRTDATLGYLSILRGRHADASALLTRAHEAAERQADPQLRALVCTRWVLHELAAVDGAALLAQVRPTPRASDLLRRFAAGELAAPR